MCACVCVCVCVICAYITVFVGVRYNAEKSQVGKYYTTPIFRFCMKCTMCENRFEIETDPKVCLCPTPSYMFTS